ncbi:DNA-3-methyladenine glycosylase 2 family protein [Candidatus Woesebacteria bacterium]|nr:DNA-3-methyladenine glycosylase 2 family protein [Candidatus Woesebacteria bacterium]
MVKKSAIEKHFSSVDPILARHFHLIADMTLSVSTNPFVDLVESITSQQLSIKAGDTIFRRFKKLFPNGRISAKAILALSDQQIRDVGVSWSKVKYIKAIAEAVQSKTVVFTRLPSLSDEEVIAVLTTIHGVGRWTAEMFLMFALGRPDIFSYGDLGLRRGLQKLYGFKSEPTVKQMEKIVKKWSPYRTYASRILWRSLDG